MRTGVGDRDVGVDEGSVLVLYTMDDKIVDMVDVNVEWIGGSYVLQDLLLF